PSFRWQATARAGSKGRHSTSRRKRLPTMRKNGTAAPGSSCGSAASLASRPSSTVLVIRGMSAARASPSRNQTTSSSSLVGPGGQRDRHIVAPGGEEAGVEAADRARRRNGASDEAQAIERRPDAVVGEAFPIRGFCRKRALAADEQARLLVGLADRRKRDRA